MKIIIFLFIIICPNLLAQEQYDKILLDIMTETSNRDPIYESSEELFYLVKNAINHEANPNIKYDERSLLYWCRYNEKVVEFLLSKGVEVSPYVLAFAGNLSTKAQDIILAKENLDMTDDEGATPLIIATRTGLAKSVKWLLDHNVELDRRDNSGYNALTYALLGSPSMNVFREIQNILLRHGVKPSHLVYEVVANSGLSLRVSPSKNAKRLTVLPHGTRLADEDHTKTNDIIGNISAPWIKTSIGMLIPPNPTGELIHYEGWLFGGYLKKVEY